MKPAPYGFRSFVRERGFDCVYLIGVVDASFLKIGVANDPVKRFGSIQAANFAELVTRRIWWLPGRKVSLRVERKVLVNFEANSARGEWFVDLSPETVGDYVDECIAEIGSWSLDSDGVAKMMEEEEGRRFGRIATRHDLFMLRT